MNTVTIENKHFILKISDTCRAVSLIHKESGEECLAPGEKKRKRTKMVEPQPSMISKKKVEKEL